MAHPTKIGLCIAQDIMAAVVCGGIFPFDTVLQPQIYC